MRVAFVSAESAEYAGSERKRKPEARPQKKEKKTTIEARPQKKEKKSKIEEMRDDLRDRGYTGEKLQSALCAMGFLDPSNLTLSDLKKGTLKDLLRQADASG